jgi:hypothetical protein
MRVLKKWAIGLSKLKQLIKQCNFVLSVLDKLEENITLYPLNKILGNFSKNTFSSSYRIKKNIRGKDTKSYGTNLETKVQNFSCYNH